MKDPIADFKTKLTLCQPNETVVYHVGALGADISSSPTLTNIQMFAYGLYLMGRAGLRQTRIPVYADDAVRTAPPLRHITEYSLKVLHPIQLVDFDTARKTYLENLKHE
jgi:hypothetical protein